MGDRRHDEGYVRDGGNCEGGTDDNGEIIIRELVVGAT